MKAGCDADRRADDVSLPDPLPPWLEQVVRQVWVLRQRKKFCMLVLRFDGLAWQIFEAAPAVKVTE